MISHIVVLLVAIQELTNSVHMIITIVSGLAVVETGAFLLVVTAFRHEITSPQNEPLRSTGDFA